MQESSLLFLQDSGNREGGRELRYIAARWERYRQRKPESESVFLIMRSAAQARPASEANQIRDMAAV